MSTSDGKVASHSGPAMGRDRSAPWMNEEHIQLADMVRRFYAAELVPHIERWRKQGVVDRDFWRKAGELGLLGASMPEEYGGSGGDHGHDFVILLEHIVNVG